jgi:hypothetical protein
MIKYLITFALLSCDCFAINKTENPFSLKLDQETFLTDKNGVFIANNVLKLIPGNAIKIYLTDGTELNGLVKSTELLNGQVFKVFGEIVNKNNTGFGFVLTKDAIFAGAVVFRDSNVTYAIAYDELRKGFTLVKQVSAKIGS